MNQMIIATVDRLHFINIFTVFYTTRVHVLSLMMMQRVAESPSYE